MQLQSIFWGMLLGATYKEVRKVGLDRENLTLSAVTTQTLSTLQETLELG